MLDLMGETRLYSQGKKVIQTLADKHHYTVHFLTLELDISLGMKKKVHRVLIFRQLRWLEPYMKLNTQKRTSLRRVYEELLLWENAREQTKASHCAACDEQ